METLFIFSTLPRTKVKWYRISQREGPKRALQALSGVQSRWSYFICKDEGYTLKISPFSNWHIQLMKISLSLSCQADWILMLFWISTNLIQLLRSDAKQTLFLQALCYKVFLFKKQSCYYKEHFNQSVNTEDLSYQRAVGTAALATLAPTLRNSFPAEQSGPHSGCSGLSK